MAVTYKDYYQTLGVARTATQDEIQKAFRKLARQYHPDVAKDKAQAEPKFKEINEAYEVLRDPDKRRKYDELGQNWDQAGQSWQTGGGFQPPPGAGGRAWRGGAGPQPDFDFEFGGTGFSDFFEAFFGSGRRESPFGRTRPGAAGGQAFSRRGGDVEADILVTLDEVLHGSSRQVTVRRPGPDGAVGGLETYQVKIPAGIREGQLIRLAGKGEPGVGSGAAGDLYLRVRLARHPDFRVQESDLHLDLDLAPWEAVLGAQLKVPVIGGTVSLKIPAGTQAGDKLRLRGLGLPKAEGGRGDLYVMARVQTPESVSPEERLLWEQLARESRFNPRNP